MRTVNRNSVVYAPASVPFTTDDLPLYLQDELMKISAAITVLAAGHIDQTYAAPAKPRLGDIRLADGTTWNPGSGQGIYAYYNSVWNKL